MSNVILVLLACITYAYVVLRIFRNATWQDNDFEDLENDTKEHEDRQ